jgi:hypothetical protein
MPAVDELVRSTSGAWMVRPPRHCPRGPASEQIKPVDRPRPQPPPRGPTRMIKPQFPIRMLVEESHGYSHRRAGTIGGRIGGTV